MQDIGPFRVLPEVLPLLTLCNRWLHLGPYVIILPFFGPGLACGFYSASWNGLFLVWYS